MYRRYQVLRYLIAILTALMAYNPTVPTYGGYAGAPGAYGLASAAPTYGGVAPSTVVPGAYGAPSLMPVPSVPASSMPVPSIGAPCCPAPPLASLAPGYGAPSLPYSGAPAPYPPPAPAAGGLGFRVPGPASGMVGQRPPGNLELWNFFQAVDSDRNGQISASELQRALVNGNWAPFNAETCRLMVGMFDLNRNGRIDINGFTQLWGYIQEWKACFDRFDLNRSGNIDASELQNAFRVFGFSLSANFTQLCIRLFDRRCTRTISFDDFIQVCVMVTTLSSVFREKDIRQTGVVTVHYEEFLRMALDSTAIIK